MIKKALVFLLVFAIISVGITCGLIVAKNKINNDIPVQSGDMIKIEESRAGTKLNQKYNENDLIISPSTLNYNGIDYEKISIIGLKDKSIESKINRAITDKIKELLNEIANENLLTNSKNSVHVYSNFSNVMSIEIYLYWMNNDEYIPSRRRTLNYDLTSGNELKLEDIFIEGTDIDALARASIYETILYQSFREGDGFFNDEYWTEDGLNYFVNKIDEKEYVRRYKEYLNAQKNDFYFTPSNLVINYKANNAEETNVYIDLERNADKVNIYTKYVTSDSIFERDDIAKKGLYVFSNTYQEEFLDDTGENSRIDIMISIPEESLFKYKNKEFSKITIESGEENHVLKRVIEKRDETQEKAQNEKDKFYYVAGHLTMYPYSKWNESTHTYIYSNIEIESGYIYEYIMDMDTYRNMFEDKIIETAKSYDGYDKIVYLTDEEKSQMEYYNEEPIDNVYSREGGKLLTTLQDICNWDENTMAFFERYIEENLYVTEERAKEIIENKEYLLTSYGIRFNEERFIGYSDIPISMLNIWY